MKDNYSKNIRDAMKKPQKITKKLIDQLSDYLDEKNMRDPKGNVLMIPLDHILTEEPYEIYAYARKKGIKIEIDYNRTGAYNDKVHVEWRK